MEKKALGWTGIPVAVVGQGTWRMGESRASRAREVAALHLGMELGMTHIDTAELYGGGHAEEIVAEAITGHRRHQAFIASKVMPNHASRRGTVAAAEKSLRRLRTDYLDLYLLHWPGRHPIADTMAGLDDLVQAGKVRFVGVSNFDVEEIAEAWATGVRIACNQVLYQLAQRGIERELVPWCREHRVAVVGYTPLAGRGFPGERSQGHAVLADIARRHRKTPRQVALRFLTRDPDLFTIPKASDPEHVRENAGATGFALEADEVAEIDRAFPAPHRRVPLATA
ncbi:MAG TPA: aldo/keto reductase [Candidatus Binatia bacterium]|nr:aldo/keto reductase [Candidatus Binatia bacterium]